FRQGAVAGRGGAGARPSRPGTVCRRPSGTGAPETPVRRVASGGRGGRTGGRRFPFVRRAFRLDPPAAVGPLVGGTAGGKEWKRCRRRKRWKRWKESGPDAGGDGRDGRFRRQNGTPGAAGTGTGSGDRGGEARRGDRGEDGNGRHGRRSLSDRPECRKRALRHRAARRL